MKKVAGTLRLDLAAYRELEAFAQLGTELDPATQKQLDRGARMVELLKQDQAKPMPVAHQVLLIKAAAEGLFDPFSTDKVRAIEADFIVFTDTEYPEFAEDLNTRKVMSDDNEKKFKEAVKRFIVSFKEKTK